MKHTPFQKTCLAAALVPLLLLASASAAMITWDPSGPQAVDVNNPLQVSTTGTFFAAAMIGPTLIVNGVTFSNYLTSPHLSIATESWGAYAPAGTDYQNLLRKGSYVTPGAAPSIISGLTIGNTYQIQLWTTYWNINYQTKFSSSSDGVTGLTSIMNLGISPNASGPITGTPQYILGTFVADGTTQNFYRFSPSYYAMMGAVQVRDITPVPDLSSWASANIGSAGGSETYSSGTFAITSTAAHMNTSYSLTDNLHYLYRAVTGDYELVARLVSCTAATDQVGMMLRTGVAPEDPHGAAFYCPAFGAGANKVLWTHTRGPVIDSNPYYYQGQGDVNSYRSPLFNPPFWLKLVKIGNNFGASWSLDGNDWVPFSGSCGGAFFATGTYNIGFFVTRGSAGTPATATFDNVYYGPPRMKYKTSWIGATSASMADGNPSNQIYSMWVKPDGTCYTSSQWDEGAQAGKVYKDGKVFHAFMSPGGGAWEGGITGNGSHIFIASPGAVYRTDFTTYVNPYLSPTPLIFSTGSPLGQVRGLAASAERIFVSDYEHGLVRVVNASTLTEITSLTPPVMPIPVPRCGPIAFDGTNFWVIQAANTPSSSRAFSFYTVETEAPKILCFQPDGSPLPAKTITFPDACIPTALAYQDLGTAGTTSTDVLWVCDNGPHQYIRKYTNLTDPSAAPTPSGTPFGVDGGIWAGGNPGQITDSLAGGDRRLYGPVGVGTDSNGNIYVACNGASHFVTDVRKFNSAGTLQWRVNGLVGVQAADFDPTSDGQQVYSPHGHFTMNYANTAPGSEWSYTGYTRDIRQNAVDPRNHVSPAFQNPSAAKLARLGAGPNNLYMYMGGQGQVGKSWLFYFNKETAVPYATNGIEGTAPNNTHRIWTDKNLNGIVDAGDQDTSVPWPKPGGTWRSFDVDSAGDIWMDVTNGIRQVICQGTQTLANGTVVPKYDLSLGNPAGYIDYAVPAPLTDVYNVNYDKTNDVLYATGKKTNGNWALVRCEKWTANPENRYNPASTWSVDLTPQADVTIMFPPPGEFYYNGLDVAGTKIFVGENYGPIHVYDTATGNPVIQLIAGPEISSRVGWINMSMGLNAFRRSNGEYLITAENAGINASDTLYRWIPAVDTSVSSAPLTLTATGLGRQIVLNWAGPMGAITSYKLYRGTSSGGETLYQSGILSPTFTDLNITPGTTYYYKVTAVNAAGESVQSNEASAMALSCGVEFVKTDTSTKGDWYTGSAPAGNYVYGSDGYELCGYVSTLTNPSFPVSSYATITRTPSPGYTATWVASTTDVKALRKPSSSTDRIASYRSADGVHADPFSWTIDVGTGWHQIALYLLDWDDHYVPAITRDTHQVKVYDDATNTVVDYRRVGDFMMGKYLVWNVTGKIRIEVSESASHYTTVASGLFFDPVQVSAPTVGWWKLDNTGGTIVTDSSGAGNNLTLSGTGNTWNASGKIGGCLNLTGAGSANLPSGLLGTLTDRTFCTWIYKTATSGAILGGQNLPGFAPILYFGTDGKLYGSYNTGTLAPMVSPSSVSNNAWHHVALTRAGNVQTIYLDGAVVGSMAAPIAADYSSAQIGSAYTNGWPNITGSPAYYSGKFDDARLYNRALNAAEIWKLFNP